MKFCCIDCFSDKKLRGFILKRGHPGKCDYCKSVSTHRIQPSALRPLFMTVANAYDKVADYLPTDLQEEDGVGAYGEDFWTLFRDDWGTFSFSGYNEDAKIRSLLKAILAPTNTEELPEAFDLDTVVGFEEDFTDIPDERSEGHKKAWEHFCNDIRHNNRFFPDEPYKNLLELAVGNKAFINAGDIFFRARKAELFEAFAPSKIGAPPSAEAIAGRGNPEGVSYLYVATNEGTAVAEVRPDIGDHLWVANFNVTKRLKVLNLTMGLINSPFRYKSSSTLREALRNVEIIQLLSEQLSKPINRRRAALEYLPTQYFCELAKKLKYDGIVYRSGVGDGQNLLVFQPTKLEYVSHKVYSVKTVQYGWEERKVLTFKIPKK